MQANRQHTVNHTNLVHDNRYMDYHILQGPSVVECVDRGCVKQMISYEYNAFTADLKIAFDINTSGG